MMSSNLSLAPNPTSIQRTYYDDDKRDENGNYDIDLENDSDFDIPDLPPSASKSTSLSTSKPSKHSITHSTPSSLKSIPVTESNGGPTHNYHDDHDHEDSDKSIPAFVMKSLDESNHTHLNNGIHSSNGASPPTDMEEKDDNMNIDTTSNTSAEKRESERHGVNNKLSSDFESPSNLSSEERRELIDQLNSDGYTAMMGEKYSEAIDIFKKLTILDASDSSIRMLMGACYYRLEDYNQAEQCYNKAISMGGQETYAEWYWNRASLYHTLGDLEKAKKDTSDALVAYWHEGNVYEIDATDCFIRLEHYRRELAQPCTVYEAGDRVIVNHEMRVKSGQIISLMDEDDIEMDTISKNHEIVDPYKLYRYKVTVEDPMTDIIVASDQLHRQPQSSRRSALLNNQSFRAPGVKPVKPPPTSAAAASAPQSLANKSSNANALNVKPNSAVSTPSKKFQPISAEVLESASKSSSLHSKLFTPSSLSTSGGAGNASQPIFSIPSMPKPPSASDFKVELVTAVSKGWSDARYMIMKYGMDYSWINRLHDDHGWYLQHWAAYSKNNADMCKLLDDFGAHWDVQSKNDTGDYPRKSTPLHVACKHNNNEVALWLLNRMPSLIEVEDGYATTIEHRFMSHRGKDKKKAALREAISEARKKLNAIKNNNKNNTMKQSDAEPSNRTIDSSDNHASSCLSVSPSPIASPRHSSLHSGMPHKRAAVHSDINHVDDEDGKRSKHVHSYPPASASLNDSELGEAKSVHETEGESSSKKTHIDVKVSNVDVPTISRHCKDLDDFLTDVLPLVMMEGSSDVEALDDMIRAVQHWQVKAEDIRHLCRRSDLNEFQKYDVLVGTRDQHISSTPDKMVRKKLEELNKSQKRSDELMNKLRKQQQQLINR